MLASARLSKRSISSVLCCQVLGPRRPGLLQQEIRTDIHFPIPWQDTYCNLIIARSSGGPVVNPKTVPVVSPVLGRPSQARPHPQPRPSRCCLFESETVERAERLKVDQGGFPRRPRQLRVSQTRLSVLLRRGSPSHPSPRGPYRGYVGYLPPTQWRPSKSCVFPPGIYDVLEPVL